MWNNEFREQLDSFSLSGSWSVCTVHQSLQEEIKAQWKCEASSGVFNYVFGLGPIHRELPYSSHCRHQSFLSTEACSAWCIQHYESIWPITDFLVFAHLSHFNVSDHNKTKGLIPKHLTSWQDNRWAFWKVCVISRTSYQQSHMSALVRLVRGCFAALGFAVFAYSMEPWVLLSSRITRRTDNDPKHTTKSSLGEWRT